MKIGTIGTGLIVDAFLSAVKDVTNAECVAMYTRNVENAKPLAEKYHVKKIYTDLDEMLADPEVNFVYVASPNSLHFDQSYRALLSGKNVICEKPFTSTLRETEKLIELAKEKQLLLFEAISNIHLPNLKLVQENLEKLGPIKFVQCNYSQLSSRYFKLLNGENPNVFNPNFSGGALADINIYNLHFVIRLFGKPDEVHYMANTYDNGIDTSGVVTMKYPSFIAECVGCKDTNSMNFVLVQGENGFLHIVNGSNGCKEVILNQKNEEIRLNAQSNTNRLYYEIVEFNQIYRMRDLDRCYELLDHSLAVMEVFEKARKDAGITFSADRL